MPYIACSSDSTNGFCPYVDTTCDQVCRTCTNQSCAPIKQYPNATIAEYGSYNDADVWKIMAEIYARGPVKASVNAGPLQDYAGGILFDNDITRNTTHNHGVSLVGWGFDEESQKQYWIVRNSWGSYWGELGFFKIELGKNLLGIEGHIAWAKPGYITEKNFPCAVDGSNCAGDANRHSGMASVY
jgi:cathepsin X